MIFQSVVQSIASMVYSLVMTLCCFWQDLNTAVATKLDLQNRLDLLRNDLVNQQGAHDREIKDLREQQSALDLELRDTREQLERQAAEYQQYQEQMIADAHEKRNRMWEYTAGTFYNEIDVGFF